jgi:hypothetical protein
MSLHRFTTPTLVVSLLLISGCRDREISVYRAPKDAPPAAPAGMAASGAQGNLPPDHPPIGGGDTSGAGQMGGAAMPTADGAGLKWTAPAGWEAKPLSAMRKGSFRVKAGGGEADVSITAFPGATGGLEANLNRWRGQVGLAPLGDAEVVATAERFEANGLQFYVVDYKGSAGHMLGAIVPFGGNSWFFKLTGPDATVVAAKPAYVEFLHTVKAP